MPDDWRPLLTTPPAGTPADAPYWCRRGCGDWWKTDPRLAVECPTCHAAPGSRCKRPSEHTTPTPHKARRELAWQRHPCSCLAKWDAEHQAPAPRKEAQADLFAVPA